MARSRVCREAEDDEGGVSTCPQCCITSSSEALGMNRPDTKILLTNRTLFTKKKENYLAAALHADHIPLLIVLITT